MVFFPLPLASQVPMTEMVMNLSFSGGGWFQMYHFGVCQALLDTNFITKTEQQGTRVRMCGSSAGALAAAALAMGGDADIFEQIRDFAVDCGNDSRLSFSNAMNIERYLKESVMRFTGKAMPDESRTREVLESMRGKLEVSATTLPWQSERRFTDFETQDELREAMFASSCLVPFCGLPFRHSASGEWVYDGGTSAFQPREKEPNTITVCPFYFMKADIRPSKMLPLAWSLFAPVEEHHRGIFDAGYNDALRFLVKTKRLEDEALLRLKPDTLYTRGKVLGLMEDGLFALLYLGVAKPLVMVFVYCYMWISTFLQAVSTQSKPGLIFTVP